MADSGQNLDQRIKELEGKLDFALRRIDELEKHTGKAPVPPVEPVKQPVVVQPVQPTPIQQPLEPPKPVASAVPPVISEPSRIIPPQPKVEAPKYDPPKYDPPKFDPPQPRQPAKPKKNIEYNIGAKVLPWAGALIVIAAIGFMIAIGVDRHWFPPQLQFAGLIALSAAFIGIGFWKRNEREDFGKILIGIGSCGMFLSFVGGHAFHHLYDWTTLMSLFMGWSVVNLAFCVFLRSRAILTIAIFGGMLAALMPLRLHDYTLSILLNLGIAIPAVIISVWRRWPGLLWLSWAATFLCLLPPVFMGADWRIGAAAIAIQALMHCAANFMVFEETTFDNAGYLSAGTIGVAGFTLICLRHDIQAAGVIALFSAISLALCYRFKGKLSFRNSVLASIGVGVILAPLCLPAFYSIIVYSTLSIVFAGILAFANKKEAMAFSWIEFGLASSLYMFRQSGFSSIFDFKTVSPVGWQLDFALVALVTLSLLSASWASAKFTGKSETVFSIASTLIIPIALRATLLYSVGSQTADQGWLTSSALVFAAGSLAMAATWGRKWVSGAVFAWINLGIATTCYIILRTSNFKGANTWEVDASLIGILLLALWGNAWMLGKAHDKLESGINTAALVTIPFLFRASYVFHDVTKGGLVTYYTTACVVLLLHSLLIVTYAGKKWSTSTLIGWGVYLCSIFAYSAAHSLYDSPPFILDWGRESGMLVALLAVGLFNSWRSAVNHSQNQIFFNIGAVIACPILIRAAFLYGQVSGNNLTTSFMTATLAVTALSVLVNYLGGTKWKSTNVLAWSFFVVAAAGYAVYYVLPQSLLSGASSPFELIALLAKSHVSLGSEIIVLLALLCGLGYGFQVSQRYLKEDGEPIFEVVTLFTGSVFVSRMLVILALPMFPKIHEVVVLASAVAIVGLICRAVFLKWDNVGLHVSAWVWAAVGSCLYLFLPMNYHLVLPTLLLFGLVVWCTASNFENTDSEPITTVVGMIGGLCLFVDLTLQVFSRSFNDPRASWIIAGAFSAYAGLLLTTGMLLKRMLIRWGSLILLGGTVAKVLLIDLTNAIDPVLRVVILFVLGMVLLGGGYLYIRTRTGIERSESEEVPVPEPKE